MIKYRINRKAVEAEMKKNHWNFRDLASEINVTPSTMNYIVRDGGKGYANILASVFGCKPEKLIVVKED